MSNHPAPEVLISEVGPRDGLQSVKGIMPTMDKFKWIDALVAAEVDEADLPGKPTFSMTPDTGLPKGFHQFSSSEAAHG